MKSRAIIISGSPSKSSRLTGLTDCCQAALLDRGITAEVLYPIDLPAERLLQADFANTAIMEAVAKVEQADAVILASPVYKASYSGVLKLFLDMLPQKGLQHKIMLPLFIGGSLAHLLAMNYALKPVVSALGGTTMLQGVYAVDKWITRLETGDYELAEELRSRINEAVDAVRLELDCRSTAKLT